MPRRISLDKKTPGRIALEVALKLQGGEWDCSKTFEHGLLYERPVNDAQWRFNADRQWVERDPVGEDIAIAWCRYDDSIVVGPHKEVTSHKFWRDKIAALMREQGRLL